MFLYFFIDFLMDFFPSRITGFWDADWNKAAT